MALVLAVVAGGDVLDLEGVPAVPSRYQLVPVLVNEPVQPDEQNVLVRVSHPRNLQNSIIPFINTLYFVTQILIA